MCATLLASFLLLSACGEMAGGAPERTKVKVLIVPKFEIGEISGDDIGEAQLFYENYCADCEEVELSHVTPTAHFYMNEDNGVGLLLTGSGKSAAGLSLMSLLSMDEYDFSDATIVSVGCSGGSTGRCVYGDVVLVTDACDCELGYGTDSRELTDPNAELTWFPDDALSDYAHERLNSELYDKAYQLIEDCPLRTTETSQRVLTQNFPDEEWAMREPCVSKGVAVSADTYWKGVVDHKNASYVAEHYESAEEYAVTEMEEVAIMNAAKCFGMKDRVISLRVVVNLDTFLEGESPETLWLDDSDYASKVTEENSETLDIFEPGMYNLFDTGSIVIDAILSGELAV